MNSSEARRITNEQLAIPLIQRYINKIYAHIEQAAKEGRSWVHSPIDTNWMLDSEADIINAKLKGDGFKIEPHTYTTDVISW